MSVFSSVLPISGIADGVSHEVYTETPAAKPPRRFMVIVENDEHHTYPYVIEVLRKVCGHDRNRAYRLTNQVHFHGQAVVWIGPLEHAEHKATMIRAYGPDRFAREEVTLPLAVRVEEFDRN